MESEIELRVKFGIVGKVIDGVEHYVIHCEVTADTHPFWTGKVHRLDTAGRIDRFAKKYDKIATGKRKTRKETVRKKNPY